MSIFATKWAYTQRVGQPGAKAILVALADHADENGFCFPSQLRLAKMTEIAPRSVRRHLAYLEDEVKLIRREERRTRDGKHISDGYYLKIPGLALSSSDLTNGPRTVDRRDPNVDSESADGNHAISHADGNHEIALHDHEQTGEAPNGQIGHWPDNLPAKPSGQSGHWTGDPPAKLAEASGQFGQSQRPIWPAAKLATKPSIESDEPPGEPSVNPHPAAVADGRGGLRAPRPRRESIRTFSQTRNLATAAVMRRRMSTSREL